jgi:cytochrome c
LIKIDKLFILTISLVPLILWASNGDGEALFNKNCVQCHLKTMPIKRRGLIAPPLRGVMRHVKMAYPNRADAVKFIVDYSINPTKEKAVCNPRKIARFGLMPSQKDNVTEDELDAIAHYMYKSYDNQKMLDIMAEKQRLARLTLHERVLEQQRCENCHDIHKDKVVAPSFEMIASRYSKKDREMLIKSIKEGTKGKWKGKKLPMPPFKKMSNKDVDGMVDWILSLKEVDVSNSQP